MSYDLFISYSRRDNTDGQVDELMAQIEKEYQEFSGEELSCFFDSQPQG